jgi:solute carrier family 34 (sodium-dependent phosphate cotransporter)
MAFGDEDFTLSTIDEYDEAGCKEVCNACCSHSPPEIGMICVGILGLAFFQYFFLFGLDLMQVGSQVMAGCRAGLVFGGTLNPISAVMIATITTAMLHSSSTTTSIVVALVGEGAITVQEAVFLIMGCNLGTTITSDMVALAQFRNIHELERAFAGGVIHDLFNLLTICVLLPFELLTGYLETVTKLIVDGAETKKGDPAQLPFSMYVRPLTNKLIISNKKAIVKVGSEGTQCGNPDWYPTRCIDGLPESFETCHFGFLGCDKKTGECPAWFRQGASLLDDQVSGCIAMLVGFVIIYICITAIMMIAQWMLKGLTTRVVYKVVNINGYLAIALSAGLTMLIESSTLVTSTLTPWVGIGVIRLELMYPLVLGANVGTTLTAVLAALTIPGLDPLQVALVHLFFNITGVLMWYPIPHLRRVPIYLARKLGQGVQVTRWFAPFYIGFTFFLVPIVVLGISQLFETGKVAAGAVTTTILSLFSLGTMYWWYYMGGACKVERFFKNYKCKRRANVDVAPGTVDGEDDDNDIGNDNILEESVDPEESKPAAGNGSADM